MAGVDGEAEGGEAACYLPLVGEHGEIADPRALIRLGGGQGTDTPIPVIHASLLSELLPRAGESVEAYRGRLETPPCRTAAWRIILAAGDEPFAIDLGNESDQKRCGPILVAYLRSLID